MAKHGKKKSKPSPPPDIEHARPGSDPNSMKAIGGKADFGVPEQDVVERTYASQDTKMSDPGAAKPRAGSTGKRVSGVGGNESGPGSSSGGDVDPDIIGVGTGGSSVAASGNIHEPPGPDDVPENPKAP